MHTIESPAGPSTEGGSDVRAIYDLTWGRLDNCLNLAKMLVLIYVSLLTSFIKFPE